MLRAGCRWIPLFVSNPDRVTRPSSIRSRWAFPATKSGILLARASLVWVIGSWFFSPIASVAAAQDRPQADSGTSAQALPSSTEGERPVWIDNLAEHAATISAPRWVGARTDEIALWTRPNTTAFLAANDTLATVHDSTGRATAGDLERVARALSEAWALASEAGWYAPPPDGNRSGTFGFDLIIANVDHQYASRADVPTGFGANDGAVMFVLLDPSGLATDRLLRSCVLTALIDAGLGARDPAEGESVRRAISASAAASILGDASCAAGALLDAQAVPGRRLIAERPDWRRVLDDDEARSVVFDGASGMIFFTTLNAREHAELGGFAREMWEFSRQRTWEGVGLRASPDVFEAIDASFRSQRQLPEDVFIDLSVLRYFTGVRAREEELRVIPEPHETRISRSELPKHLKSELVGPLGSRYVRIDTNDAPQGARLRAWLKGEFRTRWALVAVRVDAQGRELSRVDAPVRTEPNAFLVVDPIHSPGEHTAAVLIVATNVSTRLPDADVPDDNARSCRLVID